MAADLEIRPAKTDEAAALAALIDAAYAKYRDRITDMPAVSEGIGAEIAAGRVQVMTHRGRLAGLCVLARHKRYAVLINIAVDPEFSRQGIGRALLDWAAADCLRRGIGEIWLTTHVDMPENHRFYSRLGWRETGRTGNKVRMRKIL